MTKPLLIGREHNKHTFHNLSLVRLSGRVSGLAGLLGEYPLQLERIGKQLVAFVHGKLHHTPTHMRATVMNCSHISLAFHAKSWRRGCLWPGRVNIYSLLMLMFAMLSAPSKYLPCNIPCCNESSTTGIGKDRHHCQTFAQGQGAQQAHVWTSHDTFVCKRTRFWKVCVATCLEFHLAPCNSKCVGHISGESMPFNFNKPNSFGQTEDKLYCTICIHLGSTNLYRHQSSLFKRP